MLQKLVDKLNDLRPKQLLMLAGGAAVLMFMTIYFGMTLLTKQEVPPEPDKAVKPVIETSQVVVAKVNIPARTRIQESMLQMKEIPVDMVPEGAISNFDEVINLQIKVPIFAGDTFTRQKISSEESYEGFVGEIPADCRAVSINVNEVTSVAGFAKPGDKVDLLLVEKGQYFATTDVLLQNVLLLSVNQDMVGSNVADENGIFTSPAISNPTIATFALPPEDVLKLISASKLGEIYMMLRPKNPRANYVAEENYYTMESVNKPQPKTEPTPVIPSNPVPDVPLPQIPVMPTTPKIEIILGDEIVQSAENPAQIQSAANSALPAIPSGANQNFTAPPPPNVPLTNSPIVNSFYENLTD